MGKRAVVLAWPGGRAGYTRNHMCEQAQAGGCDRAGDAQGDRGGGAGDGGRIQQRTVGDGLLDCGQVRRNHLETRAHTPRRQPSLARTVVRARTRTAAQVLRRDRPTRSHARPPPAAQARPTKERGAADASPVPPTHPPPTPLPSPPSFPARPVPAALCLWWSAALLHDCPREFVRRVLLSQVLLVRTSKPSRAHMPHMSVRAAAQGSADHRP